jgi:Kef-type K+ transport system membrane component KefB
MTFSTLAVVALVGILGPLLAMPLRWHIPIVVGELLAGVLLGPTLAGALHAQDPTFTFLADIGFALVMFVAGSHVAIKDPALRASLRIGIGRTIGVGALAVPLGLLIAQLFDTGHPALYAVLIASSSAALVLPVVDSLGLGGPSVLQLLPQVAIADAACIVALPLVVDPAHAGRAAIGAAAVVGCAIVAFVVLRHFERTGLRRRLHKLSEKRRFALELRINLVVLFALAAVATHSHVSIMLAGFSFGLSVAAVGEPRRLARQLFAVTEGFFGPLFFVWLGASLNLRDLGHHPKFILLGISLGIAAVLAHAAMRILGQPLPLGALAAAQLGVPVAAATIGTQLNVLSPGEPAALILGALLTIGIATVAGSLAVRAGFVATPEPRPPVVPKPPTATSS